MPMRMIVSRVLIFCCSDTCDSNKTIFSGYSGFLLYTIAHFRDETSRICKYVYGSFCERMGSCFCL